MIQLMGNGDKYSIAKTDANETIASLTRTNSRDNNPSLHLLLTKLNIPISCFDNQQLRQHYLEEYSAKYSKAKHLLSNARKKQRKIITTYYEEKEKQDNLDELQTVKESLLEENEKIKRFKEALKEKLIIYQHRIQFLKDAEFWSALEIQQLQNNTTESIPTYTEKSIIVPTTNDSLHLLHSKKKWISCGSITLFLDHEQIKYSDNLVDDSCPTITDDIETNAISSDNPYLMGISSKHRASSQTELISEIDGNMESSISKKKTKDYFQWFNHIYQFCLMLTSNVQFDRIKMMSTILMISLAIFLVIFANDLLEYFLIYLTKPSLSITTLSPSHSMLKSLFPYWLSTIYNYTTSWLLPLFRIFEFAV